MEFQYSDRFLAQSIRLPAATQTKLARLLDLLAADPFHPLLHTKRLAGSLNQSYSFRITRDWRVIFSFETNGAIKLAKVAHRKDIYR